MTKEEQTKFEILEKRIKRIEEELLLNKIAQEKCLENFSHRANEISKSAKNIQRAGEQFRRDILTMPEINIPHPTLSLDPSSIASAITNTVKVPINVIKEFFEKIIDLFEAILDFLKTISIDIPKIALNFSALAIELPVIVIKLQKLIAKLSNLNEFFDIGLPEIPKIDVDIEIPQLPEAGNLPTEFSNDEHEPISTDTDDIEIITLENGNHK